MFSTTKAAEVPGYSLLTAGLEFGWDYVECKLFQPWFHIECRFHDNEKDEYYSKVLLVRYVDQVLSLDAAPLITITDISFVTPPSLNNQGCWIMEKLKEIWIGNEPGIEHIQEGNIFIMQNNNRYVQSALSTPENQLLEIEKVFSI